MAWSLPGDRRASARDAGTGGFDGAGAPGEALGFEAVQ
jgi:hypothetical protein